MVGGLEDGFFFGFVPEIKVEKVKSSPFEGLGFVKVCRMGIFKPS